MSSHHDVAAAALEGEVVLLIGQQGLLGSAPIDPVRAAFSQRYQHDLYSYWLSTASTLAERVATLHNVEKAVSQPSLAAQALEFSWRCVVTTAIDSALGRWLACGNQRQVMQFATPHFSATKPDGSLRLIRLFGTVDREQLAELPPTDARDLRSRREVAKAMLAHVPGLVTPNGTLFIVGWSPADDWLRPRDLSGCLTSFSPGQVVIFGLSNAEIVSLRKDEDFGYLLDDGVIIVIEETLVDFLALLESEGRYHRRSAQHGDSDKVVYRVLGRREPPESAAARSEEELVDIGFDRLEWQSLTALLTIPEEVDITSPLPREPSDQYQAFRDFISKPPGPRTLRTVRHLALRRPVLDEAVARCRAVCGASSPQETLLILRGQSCSGKSVVLCQLAVELRELGLPVVYVPPSPVRPDRNQIDLFCQHVESGTEAPVFLLYDGLRDSDEYFELAEFFASRGRKCVTVGTSYTFQATRRKRVRDRRTARTPGPHGGRRPLTGLRAIYIDVNIELPPNEAADLLEHLGRFVETPAGSLRQLANLGLNHFFAVVYRALPEARGPLEEQFLRECLSGANYIDRTMEQLQQEHERAGRGMSVLATALQEALGRRLDALLEQGEANARRYALTVRVELDEMSSSYRTLFDTVMLATWLGSQVPQSLALRVLNQNFRTYRGTFTAGLLAESEVSDGVYALSARNALEAEIWVRRHLVGRDDKIRIVRLLAERLDSREVVEDYGPELVFLIDILRALGPEGPPERRIPALYADLADVVARLRQKHGDVSARLLLMESHVTREWVQEQQEKIDKAEMGDALDKFLTRLKEAEVGLRKAYERVYHGAAPTPRGAARRLLATLETERACVLGTKIGSVNRCLPKERFPSEEVQQQVDRWSEDARQAWSQSLRWDESNRMAIDSACWIIEERFKTGLLDNSKKLSWLAIWGDIIERYASLDLTRSQEDRRDEKEVRFASRLGDVRRLKEIFARVDARGSRAAHVLMARFIAEREGPRAATEYIERNCADGLLTDAQVLPPYMRLWWWRETGARRFFPRERMLLPFDRQRWHRLLELVEAWLSFEPEYSVLLFLKACSLIHLDAVESGVQVLRALDRLGLGGYRQSKSLVIRTDEYGHPVPYNAVFQGKTRGSAHLAWCDGLRNNVEFFPVEHGKPDIRAGASIGPFYLSLNYRGLFAEPTRRIKH